MDWLILRDVLNTACNITSAAYKGVGRVGGLMMPVDIGDQAVCAVGQTDGQSSPDHTTRRAVIEYNSLGLQFTLLMHPSGPHRVCVGPAWLGRVGKSCL